MIKRSMVFNFFDMRKESADKRVVGIENTIIAGWTGRDHEATEQHIKELEAVGIARPEQTPMFYRVSCSRLTTDEVIEIPGVSSSGEVEFVLLQDDNELWVGVGSDHTDREVEAYGVTVSKQMCDKPLATEFWRFDDLSDHWDTLIMRSFIEEGGQRITYQEGLVNAILPPNELIARYTGAEEGLAPGTLMFCGTLAATGGIRPSTSFEFELFDPVLNRSLSHKYKIVPLAIEK